MEKFPDLNNQLDKEKSDFYKEIREWLFEIIKEKGKRSLLDRITKILECFGMVMSSDFEKPQISLDNLDDSCDDTSFVELILNKIKPVLDLKFSNPINFDKAMEMYTRSSIEENKGYIKLNDLLYFGYGSGGSWIHIHVAPNERTENKISLFRDGLKKLTVEVFKDKRIKTIFATSWIVAEHPGLLKRMGFVLDGPIDDETKSKYFLDESRQVARAHITREQLLKNVKQVQNQNSK